jgi:hypothetical protein
MLHKIGSFWREASLVLALAFAVASPAFAQQGKPAAPKITKAEARYDTPQQAELMQRQIAALAPQKSGVTDVYVIGVAGWATQDVFLNELNGMIAVAGKALPLSGTVRLINSPETSKDIPLASRQNFAAAVRAVGRVMDKDEDVLMLFMTSHGTRNGIALQLPAVLVPLSPREVAAVLNREGIKYRLVIVSACYSGVFVKPLANESTIVLTAADARSTSFGCADKRQWTYFGDALFNHSLKAGVDLQVAFANARGLIAGWEKFDRFKPSNPQAHFGAAAVRKLTPLIETMGQQAGD